MASAGSPSLGRRPLSVLVVDDSAVVRQGMTAILSQEGATVVVAANPYIAMEKIRRARPDIILLDIEMPRMDGLTFLRKIMREDPIPVVICSGVALRGTEAALRALEEGAVGLVAKPKLGVRDFLQESAVLLTDAVYDAAQARLRPRALSGPAPRLTADAVLPARARRAARPPTAKVVAVGASTGGTEALHDLLGAMPPEVPGIVIVQHMPEGFTKAFADRLNRTCRIEVKEAEDGDPVLEGRALIAPGNRHLLLRLDGDRYTVAVTDGALVSRHRPSVDVLFRSIAQTAGANAVGAILTGMGDDGAAGLLEMKQAGASTLAQDEETCVVFGMPRESIARGGVDEVVPLHQMAAAILHKVQATGIGPPHLDP
jgi:two-component system chemotaxis response regulator CheB